MKMRRRDVVAEFLKERPSFVFVLAVMLWLVIWGVLALVVDLVK